MKSYRCCTKYLPNTDDDGDGEWITLYIHINWSEMDTDIFFIIFIFSIGSILEGLHTALVIPWLKYIEYWISPIDANSSSSSCIWHWYLNGLIIQLVEMGWGWLSMFEIILFPRLKWRKIFIGIDQILLSILCNIFIGKNIYICINLYYFRKNLFRSIKFRSKSTNLSLHCGQ